MSYTYPTSAYGGDCMYGGNVGSNVGYGNNNNFVIIVVLFILLIIVGAAFYC
ncbi:uncharacterized protein (TIGR01732 family) [Aquisalibacillus elongatus]|uniref:Uncharacterized protein (TIGR01732 family) n=1 Tax=Aquisalibacillus elongatus TaxID=485577 RepID=A0A3N5C2N7_9BACI|nr:uncharacterized protein (TIGR01732 family) [Aquisalibacillus elongatus]